MSCVYRIINRQTPYDSVTYTTLCIKRISGPESYEIAESYIVWRQLQQYSRWHITQLAFFINL